MHGFFDLKEGQSEAVFAEAYRAFADHLIERQLITASRVMRRSPNDNYDSTPPQTKYYVSMDFVDLAQSEECWDYIESHEAASTQLHRAVYARIESYSFFLSEDI